PACCSPSVPTRRSSDLYDEDGNLAFSPETLEAWFDITERLLEADGQPSPEEGVEIAAGGPDLSVLATNEGATAHFWTNQLGPITDASGRDIELLRFPGESENERTGMYFKPAMYYSISSGTDHPEEAARFVDYLLNSTEAAEVILSDLGLPANLEVREAITDSLSSADERSATFLSEVEDEIVDGNPPPPIGSGEIVTINERIYQELSFGNLTAEEAAAQFIEELEAVIETDGPLPPAKHHRRETPCTHPLAEGTPWPAVALLCRCSPQSRQWSWWPLPVATVQEVPKR